MKHLTSYVYGTGDWLRESKTFREWEDGTEKGCLWVRGIPGSGKSVFAASTAKALAETQDAKERTSPVVFFFFRQIVEKNHDPKYLVRDWVAQLLPFSTNLQREVDGFSKEGVDGNETTKLWDALVRAMEGIKKVYCVADALDEMDDQHTSFIDKLKQLGAQRPGSIKVMLTSRPIPRIENQLRYPTVVSVKLEPMQIYPDIVCYVSTRLENLEPRLGQEKEVQVKEAICERSEGLFLYARLTMDTLTEGLQEGSIVQDTLPISLAQLPRSLTELYARMLAEHSRRSHITQDQQLTILQCITQSSRPLRLIELGSVMALLAGDIGPGLKEGKEVVRQACGRFLEILDDESVSVIHHSFTEFVRDKSRSREAGAFLVLDGKEAQKIMLKVCLQYLESCKLPYPVQISVGGQIQLEEKYPDGDVGMKDEESENDPNDNENDSFDNQGGRSRADEKKRREIQDLRSLYPFMAYATDNLVHHIKNAEAGNDFDLLDSYFVPGKTAFEIWLLVQWHQYRRGNVKPLHIAAYHGLIGYAQHLIATCSVIDAQDAEGQTPLMYAAQKGHLETASLLLSNGANIDADDRSGYQPLHIAVQHNQPDIVRLLLTAGVSPKTKKTKCTPELMNFQMGSDIGETPWQYACTRGNVDILAQFIEYLDVDDICKGLHWTVRSLKPDAVEVILKAGKAPVDVLVDGLSALVIASTRMEPAVMEVLLRNGANPNLGVKTRNWRDEVTPDAEIKLEGDYENGPTAMHALAGFERHQCLWSDRKRGAESIKLLVDAGGDVNARTVGNYTPLHYTVKERYAMFDAWASEGTQEIMTEILLQHGADPNVRCNSGATPLHMVSPGRPEVVDILIRNGADVNARDDSYSTPLISILESISDSWDDSERKSSMESKEKTILKLLEHGADVTAKDANGWTALHHMFAGIDIFQNESLWKAFIKSGADLNQPNKNGDPPLFSVELGDSNPKNDGLLSILVKNGLKLNPLVLFKLFDTDNMNRGSFQRLLNLGCSAKARDQNGTTLLHRCIEKRASFEIFELLIKAGTDPTAVDNEGNTLFHEAALGHPGISFASEMKALVEMGVCTGTQNNAGRTALHITCATRANHGATNKHERSEEFLDLLLNGKLCPALNANALDNFGASSIHYAASFSEFHVGRLLKAGADPTLKTKEGLTSLHIAARGRQSTVICLLISEYRKCGILPLIINASDDGARTALHYACRSGRPESVSHLLSAGANFSLRDRLGRTPFHTLAELEEENLLWTSKQAGDLPKGFDAACVTLGDLGRPCSSQRLELRYSDSVRTKDIIEMLEIAGADLNARYLAGGEEGTLMDLAVQAKCSELVNELRRRGLSAHDKMAEASIPRPGDIMEAKALLERAEPPGRGDYQAADCSQASKSDHLKTFEEILQRNDYNLFNNFVKMGGNLCARGGRGHYTALHKLIEWGHTGLLKMYSEDAVKIDNEEWMQEEENPGSLLCLACEQPLPRLEIIKVLVENVKVDVNYISNRYDYTFKGSKATALHWLSVGAHFWNIEAIEFLLDHGADIEARNELGETPLMTAVGSGYPNGFWKEETLRVLLEHGANPNTLRDDGYSCLNMADHANVTRMLLDHGASINISNFPPLTSALETMNVDAARLLLEAGADPDKCHALYEAARPFDDVYTTDPLRGQRQREMISLLVKYGADPFAFLGDGFSILQKVIEEHGILDLFWALPNFPVELRGGGGRTPLISACFPTMPPVPRNEIFRKPKPKLVCEPTAAFALLDMQANVRVRDDLGRTALHWICTLPEEMDETRRTLLTALVSGSLDTIHQKDNEGFTPLQVAIANSYTHDTTSYLISCGSDPKEPDPTSNTVLHYLAPHLLGERAKALAAAEKFKTFLLLGVPIDHRNNLGETALFRFISTSWEGTRDDTGNCGHPKYAIENDISHVKALHLFLDAGADLHTRNNQGASLLHITSERWQKIWGRQEYDQRKDMLDTFKDLMGRGLDPRAEDAKCRTAIDVAVTCGNTFLVDLFGPKEKGVVNEVVVDDTEDEEDDDVENSFDVLW